MPVSWPDRAYLSIILVNWNGGELLARAIASVERELSAWAGEAEILVVDNASTDGSADALAHTFPHVGVIRNRTNLGYAAAANRGLAASRGDLVLFLNPDVEVMDGAIARCAQHLRQDPKIALAGCRLLNPDLTRQRSVENFLSVSGLVLDNILSLPLLARLAAACRRAGLVPPETGAVDWVHGAFMLCRRSALEEIGGFDPDYFMYAEDMDLCYRLRRKGYRVAYVDEAAAVHVGQASSAKLFGAKPTAQILRSTILFFRKHRGRHAAWAFRTLAAVKFLLRATSSGMLALVKDREQHAAEAAAYWRMAGVCVGLW